MFLIPKYFDWWMPKIFVKSWIQTAAALAGGTGSVMEGVSSFMEGGEKVKLPWQTKDYYNYASAMKRATQAKILDYIAKSSYEAAPGMKNLSNVAYASAMSTTETPPPNYMAQAAGGIGQYMGTEGVAEALEALQAYDEEQGVYAPYADIYPDEGELTEWDKKAQENGITVTKYNRFETAQDLQRELYAKNWAETDVGLGQIHFAQQITSYVISKVAPQLSTVLGDMCAMGQCDIMFSDIIRTIKTYTRTAAQMGDDFDYFEPVGMST